MRYRYVLALRTCEIQRLEAGLVNRNVVFSEPPNLRSIDVGAANAVACLSQTGAYDESDVAGANYRNVHELIELGSCVGSS